MLCPEQPPLAPEAAPGAKPQVKPDVWSGPGSSASFTSPTVARETFETYFNTGPLSSGEVRALEDGDYSRIEIRPAVEDRGKEFSADLSIPNCSSAQDKDPPSSSNPSSVRTHPEGPPSRDKSAETEETESDHQIIETIKERLRPKSQKIFRQATPIARWMGLQALGYRDILFTARTLSLSGDLRKTLSVHLINHVLKTRDAIIRTNQRLLLQSRAEGENSGREGGGEPKPRRPRGSNHARDRPEEENDSSQDRGCLFAGSDEDDGPDDGPGSETDCRPGVLGKDDDIRRDQGFVRPKVLVMLETRSGCYKWTEALMSVCQPPQQENKRRLEREFGGGEAEARLQASHPEGRGSGDSQANNTDYRREIFEGNNDNDFRIGIKFTRKSVKFFAPFYQSDLILASPLGLRRSIQHPRSKEEDSQGKKENEYDYDFLSSIEILVLDQGDLMMMQNWSHVEYVISRMNLLPKASPPGCDFTRVREHLLEGQGAFFRQTILLSAFLTPTLNFFFERWMKSHAGKIKVSNRVSPSGLLNEVCANAPVTVVQTLTRFDSPSRLRDPDARFGYFCSAVLPHLARSASEYDSANPETRVPPGILILVPSYLDFVRVRNLFRFSNLASDAGGRLLDTLDTLDSQGHDNPDYTFLARTENPLARSMSVAVLSEYSDRAESQRVRAQFRSGKIHALVYSGRAHHFSRYRSFPGLRYLVFYAPPDNPIFYQELVSELAFNSAVVQQHSRTRSGSGTAHQANLLPLPSQSPPEPGSDRAREGKGNRASVKNPDLKREAITAGDDHHQGRSKKVKRNNRSLDHTQAHPNKPRRLTSTDRYTNGSTPESSKQEPPATFAPLQVRTLLSKWDFLALERIVGSSRARAMVSASRDSWEFL